MEDRLIWVDEQDRIVGSGPKMRTHVLARLHRAFSLFLVDREGGQVLLQRRAKGKYHSGGLWSNACCSHPRFGETLEEAVRKRTAYELGIQLLPEDEVTACGHFVYRADYEELSEHELDHVFVCRKDPALIPTDRFRPDEVEAMKWVETGELRAWMLREPEAFSAWFAPAWKLVEQTLFPEEGKETGAQTSHDGKELP